MVEFSVLGPLETRVEGEAIRLQAEKPRALLALLLLRRNRVVALTELVDGLWGDEPPETARSALQVYVSQLRKAIGADRVLTKPPGYALRVEDGELDLERFERLVQEGREQLGHGDAEGAASSLREALELWRGPALAEFPSERFAADAARRLEESRLEALELRIDADISLGQHAPLVSELESLVSQEPFRERFRAQLMLALYGSGRQAAALDVYRRTRETFVDELGIEPSRELQELEKSILQHDEALRVGRPTPAAAAPPTPVPKRRAVSILALLAIVAAVVGTAVFALGRGGSSQASDHDLRTFVSRLENFLSQSRDGRREVVAAMSGEFRCKLAPRDAVERLTRVQRNRQSLLQQIAALNVPDNAEARESSDLLQKAAQASIAADWHYRDWLRGRTVCGPPDESRDIRAALAADRRATQAKRAFVTAFNPLARRVGQKRWSASDF